MRSKAWSARTSTCRPCGEAFEAGGVKFVRPVWNEELLSRADEELAGKLENEVGYYRKLTEGVKWGPGDLCWVLSNSGRNALVVELALEAKRHGVKIIALTSLAG